MKRALISILMVLVAVGAFAPTLLSIALSNGDPSSYHVICTAHGVQVVALDADGQERTPGNGEAAQEFCPLCSLSALAGLQSTPSVAEVVRYAAVTYTVLVEVHRSTPKPNGRSARGPPQLQA